MPGRLSLTHSGLRQINACGTAFPHHKQLGTYLTSPQQIGFQQGQEERAHQRGALGPPALDPAHKCLPRVP